MAMELTWQRLRLAAALGLLVLGTAFTPIAAQQPADPPRDCDKPLPEPITVIKLSNATRGAIPTRDGCWVFAAFHEPGSPGRSGVGVLRRTVDRYEEAGFLPLPFDPKQTVVRLALTHDQKTLIVSHSQQVTVVDVEKLTSGQGDPILGRISGPRVGLSFGVQITPDDKYAFVVQGQFASVLVIDLSKGRASGSDESALVGVIPIAFQATDPVLSPDAKYLFVPSKLPPDVIAPTFTCLKGKQPEGAVQIIDAQKATADARSATIGFASPAGCDPTGVSLSPDGARLSVTAGDIFGNPKTPAEHYALVLFDVRPIREGKSPTLLGKVPLEKQAVGVVDTGSRILVSLLGPNSKVLVVDPAKVASGSDAIVGSIPVTAAGGRLLDDGRTLIAAQAAGALVIVDLKRALPEPSTK